MEIKPFNGKAIYTPSGKAGEYSKLACNFYVGCSNGCEYCYCKKGILAGAMGQDKPQLKKCFKDEEHALKVFESELSTNIVELQKHGLFFSFTTDPMLRETRGLTLTAAGIASEYNIPVKILTKCTEFAEWFVDWSKTDSLTHKELWYFGFTLTGHDELEPNASTNWERIKAMKKLHNAGFKTFASIEPIVDFECSEQMIADTKGFCDLYKIGLESGKKYKKSEIVQFMNKVNIHLSFQTTIPKVYFKDSLLKQAGVERKDLPANCVTRDYSF